MLKYELKKLCSNKLFLPSIIVVLALWAFIINNTRIWSPNNIVSKSMTFWHILGSLTLGFIILMINTRLFSMDTDEKVEEVFNTTRYGKRKLFVDRLKATMVFSTLAVLIFIGINLGLTFIFSKSSQLVVVPYDISITSYFIIQNFIVILGASVFAVFSALLCDSFKSHNITLIICGLLYGISYITRTSMVDKYSIHWILERGFFSFIIRGKILTVSSIDLYEVIFWMLWYVILMCLMIGVNKKIQLRRKEL